MRTGCGASQARIASGPNGVTKRPSGFASSLPIFARRRFGAMPTEQVRPQAARTSARRRSPSVRASPKRWTVPEMSRNASSTDTPSTNGE